MHKARLVKLFLFLFCFFLLTNYCLSEDIFLNIDLNIPANQDYVDLPVVSIQGKKRENRIGYGIHIDDWAVTNYLVRVHMKNKLRKKLEIKKDTHIILSGEYEVEKTSHGMVAHKFFVEEPKEIEYIACGVYVDYYTGLMGEAGRLVGRSFPESFKK